MKELSIKLKFLRKGRKKTLDEVAKSCEFSKTTLHDLESGKESNPTLRIISSLAKYYGLSIDSFVD